VTVFKSTHAHKLTLHKSRDLLTRFLYLRVTRKISRYKLTHLLFPGYSRPANTRNKREHRWQWH